MREQEQELQELQQAVCVWAMTGHQTKQLKQFLESRENFAAELSEKQKIHADGKEEIAYMFCKQGLYELCDKIEKMHQVIGEFQRIAKSCPEVGELVTELQKRRKLPFPLRDPEASRKVSSIVRQYPKFFNYSFERAAISLTWLGKNYAEYVRRFEEKKWRDIMRKDRNE